jgi:hypothetical protein
VNKLYKIIKEEVIKFLREYDNDTDWSYYEREEEREEEIKLEIMEDFLYKNNPNFTKHVPWTVVPFPRLKKIWEDYMYKGFVRDTRGLEMIEEIMVDNTRRVNIFTALAGHTQWGDQETLDENIGYWVKEQINCLLPLTGKVNTNQLEIPFNNPKQGHVKKEPVPDPEPCKVQIHPFAQKIYNEEYDEDTMSRENFCELLYEKMTARFFDYYMWDSEGIKGGFISDYGLEPLIKLVRQLHATTSPEEKLVLIDQMLNVVHQRSDIANWFVEGGSRALAQLSGSPSEVKQQ